MEKPLSIKAANEEIKIETNRSDYAAALVRGIIGAAPVVGPMVAEALAAGIPNQKLERVISFTKLLEDKLNYLEEEVLKEKFKTEEFGDLLEDALLQASGALSPERREYIANLLTNSLTDADLDHIGEKKLLSLLNDVNDAEMLLLKFYSLPDGPERESMIAKYAFIKPNLEKQSEEKREGKESILFSAYWGHLVMTSLIYGNQGSDEKPTKLGLILLKYVGLIEET